jgi:hypothetical protein
MPRSSHPAIVLCWLLVSGALCLGSTSSVVAKNKSQKSSHGSKHRQQKSHKSAKVTAEAKQVEVPTPRTPLDKGDCIAVAQAFYRQATTLYTRTKIPEEFERVTSKLDEFCGEEEFEKARASLDWMSTCLNNYKKDRKSDLCTRNTSYFCAIDPQSDGCPQNQSKIE